MAPGLSSFFLSSRDGWGALLLFSSTSTCSTSSNSLNDPEDQPDSENGVKTFVPLKKKKLSAKDHVGEAVELLKTMVQNDPSKELMRFMQNEAEKSRKHELEMTKLLLNDTAPPNQHAERANQMHSWPQQYHPNALNFQHHQPSFQAHPISTEGFATPTQTYSIIYTSCSDIVGKHYHTL